VKIRSRWLTRALAWIAVRASQLLFRTCRIVCMAPETWLRFDQVQPQEDRRGVLCVWHDSLLIPTIVPPAVNRRITCCLVSRHQDGSYLAEAMDFLGYSTVRGSSKRGGAGALKQLLGDTAGKHIVITPDGPRGPRRQLKPGAIYVASQTGRPVCASAFACRRSWRVRGSWTDMIIPQPFTTVYCVIGTPLPVPPELARDELQRYQDWVQAEMDRLNEQVEKLARGEIERIEFEAAFDLPRAA
jgi:lysophospholipid acyltransferase (LPLAT)-like uncharacterized protein